MASAPRSPVPIRSRTEELMTLSAEESAAWGGLLRTHKALMQFMGQQLETHHGLALNSYDVLRHLALADDARLRMHELAGRVMITRSGLSGVVGRLETEGLLERSPDSVDGRGLYAQLTPLGWQLLREATITITTCIRQQFFAPLDAGDVAALREVWRKLARPNDGDN